MLTSYKNVNNLKVAEDLLFFVNNELLKDIGINQEKFWQGFDEAVHDLSRINKELLKKRQNLQKKLMNGILKIKAIKLKLKNIKNF